MTSSFVGSLEASIRKAIKRKSSTGAGSTKARARKAAGEDEEEGEAVEDDDEERREKGDREEGGGGRGGVVLADSDDEGGDDGEGEVDDEGEEGDAKQEAKRGRMVGYGHDGEDAEDSDDNAEDAQEPSDVTPALVELEKISKDKKDLSKLFDGYVRSITPNKKAGCAEVVVEVGIEHRRLQMIELVDTAAKKCVVRSVAGITRAIVEVDKGKGGESHSLSLFFVFLLTQFLNQFHSHLVFHFLQCRNCQGCSNRRGQLWHCCLHPPLLH